MSRICNGSKTPVSLTIDCSGRSETSTPFNLEDVLEATAYVKQHCPAPSQAALKETGRLLVDSAIPCPSLAT